MYYIICAMCACVCANFIVNTHIQYFAVHTITTHQCNIKQINTQYNLIEALFNHEKKAEQVLRILQTRKIINGKFFSYQRLNNTYY